MTAVRLTASILVVVLALPLCGQDETATETESPKANDTEKPKSALKVAEEDGDAVAEFKKLNDRRLEIFNQLQKLKKDFDDTNEREKKQKIRDEFNDLIREFESRVYPELRKLAADVYEKDATQLDAGEIVLQQTFNENQFEKAAEVAEALMKARRRTQTVVSLGGVSLFATHRFDEALSILSDADKAGRLIPRYASYLDSAKLYVDYWKKEQEIREKEATLTGDQALPQVQFATSKGKIVFELFEDQAPNTVANFISLVEAKKYDSIRFHRVIAGFMAQGGDPNTLDNDPTNDGSGGPGYNIKCECYREDARMHFRGSLSMAHAGTDTGGSQFFITHLPTEWLNPRLEPKKGGHTVFGRVIEGIEVASALKKGDSIETATVVRKRPHEYKPETTPEAE